MSNVDGTRIVEVFRTSELLLPWFAQKRTRVPSIIRRLTARSLVDIATTGVMLIAACVLIWATLHQSPAAPRTARAPLPLPKEPVSIVNSPTIGDGQARVVVIQFSDFQCPACEHFALRMWPSFRQKWIDSSRMQLAFRHFPVNSNHARAAPAAWGASCAATQGRFWPMHDRLFGASGNLTDADLRRYAGGIGVDLGQFDECISAEGKDVVARDVRLANALGLRVTPTFLVGRRTEVGMVQVTSILEGIPTDAVFESAYRAAGRSLPTKTTHP